MLLLLLTAVLLVAVAVHIVRESRKNYPPGPFNFPFLGSLVQGRLINNLAYHEFKRLGDQYGNLTFFKLFMDQPVLVVRGYDLIKETHFNRAFSGVGQPLTFREHGLHRRRGLIFSDGANWQQMRRFVVRALHDQGFGRQLRTDNINDELAEVLDQLMTAAAAGREVKVRRLFTLASANSLLLLVVGRKLARDGQLQHLNDLVDRNVKALGPSYLHLDMFPWLRYVAPDLSGYRQFHDDVQELVNLFRPLIAEHAAALDAAGHDEPPRDLVDAFLQQQKSLKPPHAFNDENLRVLLKDLLLAGLETTNTVMEWVILALVQHPDVQERAAAEVEEVIGRDRSPAIADMATMPYLEAVIEESLRWTPAVPVIQHSTTFGAVQLGGYHVPANCRVLFDFHSVLHDAAFWGDPERYRPERFLGPDAARLRERMVAFGLGSRHCIGEAHGRQSLFLFTAGVLQRLRLQLSPGQQGLRQVQAGLVVKPQEFTVTVHLRE